MNMASDGASGFFNEVDGTVNISNTIIAQNTDSDCGGTFISTGFNLIGNNSSCEASFPAGNPNTNNDIVGNSTNQINAKLDPAGVQNNGGPTRTIALQSTSPAIDQGNPAAPGSGANACEPTDQRGARTLINCLDSDA
jgi:hypothetical protein